jgi:hypothetical protein
MGERMMDIWMQDKRARKKTPAYGTKMYPLIYVGKGMVQEDTITVYNASGFYVISQGRISRKRFRVYVNNESEGYWINNPVWKI